MALVSSWANQMDFHGKGVIVFLTFTTLYLKERNAGMAGGCVFGDCWGIFEWETATIQLLK